MNERVVSGISQEEDHSIDNSLRPKRLSDYIGQTRLKTNLEIAIAAAVPLPIAPEHIAKVLAGHGHVPHFAGRDSFANLTL